MFSAKNCYRALFSVVTCLCALCPFFLDYADNIEFMDEFRTEIFVEDYVETYAEYAEDVEVMTDS